MLRMLITTLLFSSAIHAACQCLCVDGNVEAICNNTYEIRPICTPRVCPIAPPSVAPIDTPRVAPIGTTHCRQSQVYNEQTRRYEWHRVCE